MYVCMYVFCFFVIASGFMNFVETIYIDLGKILYGINDGQILIINY